MVEDFERHRPAGVIVLSILTVLGGLLSLGMIAAMAHAPEPKPPVLAGDIVFSLVAVWAFVNAAGLLFLQQWARISVLTFQSQVTAGFCLAAVFVVIMFILTLVQSRNVAAIAIITVVVFAFAAIGIWSIVYLNRRAIVAQFLPPGTRGALLAARRPFSISLIAGFMAYSGLFTPLIAFTQPRAFVLMAVLHGAAAVIYNLLYGAAFLISGVMLWRLKPHAWKIASGVLLYAVINVLLVYLTPAGRAMMDQIESQSIANANPQSQALVATMFKAGVLAGLGGVAVVNAILIAILYWKRAAFRPPTSSPEI